MNKLALLTATFLILLIIIPSDGRPGYIGHRDFVEGFEGANEEEFSHTSKKTSSYRKERALFRSLLLKPETPFMEETSSIYERLKSEDNVTVFKGDIPYSDSDIDQIQAYFDIKNTEQAQNAAMQSFVQALTLIQDRLNSKRRKRHGTSLQIIRHVEEAAEQGYLPAVVAYGVMNRHGLFGLKKNIPLAQAFFRIAGEAGSGKALTHLAELRKRHYTLDSGLTKSALYRQNRIPGAKLLRAAAISGDEEAARGFRWIMHGNKLRYRLWTLGKGALKVFDGILERGEKVAKIAAAAA